MSTMRDNIIESMRKAYGANTNDKEKLISFIDHLRDHHVSADVWARDLTEEVDRITNEAITVAERLAVIHELLTQYTMFVFEMAECEVSRQYMTNSDKEKCGI